jgi:hypothetical protein
MTQTREALVELMARGICAGQGMYWEDQFGIYSSNGDPSAHDPATWLRLEAFKHDAAAALAALEAAGVRLVTADMLNAAFDAFDAADGHFRIDGDAGPWLTCDGHNAAFNAALAASPYAKDKPE